MELNLLAKNIHLANVEKGFYEDNANLIEHLIKTGASEEIIETAKKAIVGQRLSLIHSEVSEALEGSRKNKSFKDVETPNDKDLFKIDLAVMDKQLNPDNLFKHHFEGSVKDTVEDEVADAIIRLLDFCGAYEIDVDFHVSQKLRYNALRPHKHGKKY
jgi:NTP pyrophosphatase (non-canonical NTP hydrolase)